MPLTKLRRIVQADVARFLRVELHAGDVAALDDGGERLAVLGGGDRVAGDRRGVGVREVHLRAVGDAVDDRRRRRVIVEAVPADVRHLEPRSRRPSSRRHGPDSRPRPGQSGASSLPSNSHCMPRQMPSSGRPSPTRARIASTHAPSSARVAPKWPTPGTMMPSRVGELVRRVRREHVGADRGERLAHRRQVAGAVVDERDHSRPLVLGSIRASRLSFAQATRSARANALKTASIL